MVDLDKYPYNTALTSAEIAEWLEVSQRTVLRMPIPWLPRRRRMYVALAGDVREVYLGKQSRSSEPRDFLVPNGIDTPGWRWVRGQDRRRT